MTLIRTLRALGLAIAVCAIILGLIVASPSTTSASNVSLTIPSDPDADPIELSGLSFADASSTLAPLSGTPLLVDLPGLPAQTLESIEVDAPHEMVVLTGSSGVMVLATWGGAPVPRVVFAVDAGARSFSDLGFVGDLMDDVLPRIVLSTTADGAPITIPAATLPASATALLGGLYPGAPVGQMVLSGQLDAGARLSLGSLPASLSTALGGGEVLVTGSLGANDFRVLSGSAADTSSLQLQASLPSLGVGALPDWLTLTAPNLTIAVVEGAARASLTLDATADVGGSALAFGVGAVIDFDAGTAVLDATLASPWAAPFGVTWLTLDQTTLTLEIDSGGTVNASLSAAMDAGGVPVSLDIALSGGEGVLTASVASLSSTNLAALFGSEAGVPTPTNLPDLSLSNLTVAVDTATEAFSVAGDVTFSGVSGSLLASVIDRGDGRELILGVGISSTTLGALPLGLSGAAAAVTLPAVSLAYVDAPASVAIAFDHLTAAEQLFFSGRFGMTGDPGSALSLVNGLNLEADLPLAELPAALRDALGLGSSGSLLLAGSLEISGGSVAAATLDASLPGTPTISGMPAWFAGDPGVPFDLGITYDGSVGTFGVSAGFLVSPDGDDTVPFLLTAVIATDGSVAVSGASTAAWPTPFGQQWLASLDETSIAIDVNPGGESSASLTSSFVVGTTTFTLELAATGESGSVDASFTATADQVTAEDILALLAATGADTSGLELPEVTARDIVLRVSAGTSGFAFELGGEVDLFGRTGLDLALSLVADGSGGLRVVGGIRATDLSLSDLVPDTAGTFAGDLTLENLAVVVSVGGEPVASGDLSPVLRDFFDPIYGASAYEVELGSGVTLIASTSIPEELTAVTDALGGLTVSNLVISGSIGIPWGSGSSAGLSLSAEIPRLEFPSGGPDWFRYASLTFEIAANATTGTFEVRLGGELGVTITESPTKSSDLTFTVDGELKAAPTGVQFSLGGGLSADEPWEQPFGIEWLVINDLSIYLSFDATTQGFGVELGGDVVLGVAPQAKQLAVAIGLELNVATGIPTNFVFEASSTSSWGLQDLVTLYSYLDPAGGEVLADIPDIQLRPVDADTPIRVKFALKNSPNVSAGFQLSGALWVELTLDQPLQEVAVLDIDVGTAGIFLDGSSSIPISLGVATLQNAEFDLDWTFQPAPDFAFFAAADLESELFGNTRLEVQIPFDLDFNALLEQTLADLQDVEAIWADLKPLLESDPLATLDSQTIRDLYAQAGQTPPEWIQELLAAIDALPNIEGVPTSPVGLVDAVLGGFTISVPPGQGYPVGGVAAGTCAPLATGSNGHCYITLPSAGVEQGFDTVTVCDFAIYEDGDCWIVPPSLTLETSLQTFCPTGFSENGRCWLIPPSITTTVSSIPGCADFGAILEGGRCWSIPPSVTWQSGYVFGVCAGIVANGTCWGIPPGPPVSAAHSYPTQLCPGLTILSDGKCYEPIPGPPLLTYPSYPTTGCVPPLIESDGSCWSPIPGPPVEANTAPYQKQVCAIPGVIQDGKCWVFGQTPSSGTPVGGFEPGCPIWVPFFAEGDCWTFPPTAEIELISFPGICHELDIACSLSGLIEESIIQPIVDDIRTDLTPYTVAPSNADPIASAGGPYTVSEGASIGLSAAASSDPDGDAVTVAWDLDNDGLFDDASGVSATFSAAGLDGPGTRTVGVRVTDAVGNTDIARVAVQIVDTPPSLTVTGPAQIGEMAPYTLRLRATDPGPDTLAWWIDWGDGRTSTASGRNADLTHRFTGSPLNPTIVVRASDEDGEYSAATKPVTVIAVSPTIDATITSPIVEGGVAMLTGSIIEPGGDDALVFTVDWGDGPVDVINVPAGATSYAFTHRYLDDRASGADTYPVQVEAVNEDGLSDGATATVTVNNAAPTLDITGAAGDEGAPVRLLGLVQDPGPLDAFTVEIDWGDGISETVHGSAHARGLNVPHTYADDGTYVATVLVTDDDGGTGSATATFEIANVTPTIVGLAAVPAAMHEHDAVQLHGSIVEPGADAVSVEVDWGDGTVETFQFGVGEQAFSLTHRYLDDRSGEDDLYPVSFEVTDDDGGTSASTIDLGVANVAPADVTLTLVDDAIDEDGTVQLSGTFADPGTLDTFVVVIDWGDGTAPTELELGAGERSFAADHRYADDNPTGTSSDAYAISIDVTDDDLGHGTGETVVTVANAAPRGVQLSLAAPTIDEDGIVDLHGRFADPGADDTFTVSIDWGDGSEATLLTLDTGERDFDASHRYQDDAPTGTSSDAHTISVEVLDDDGGTGTGTSEVLVRNVAPSSVVLAHQDEIAEDGTLGLGGTFVDPGMLDTFVVTIDWGDGSDATVLELSAGDRAFDVEHQYLDDNPTGTPLDEYVVTVAVDDDDLGSATTTSAFTVRDIAPVVSGTPATATMLATETHTVEASFTDVGALDTHTAVIDWGDGTDEVVTVDQSAGAGTLTGSHRYVDPGSYVITISVTDDDDLVGVTTLALEVLGPRDLKEQVLALLDGYDDVRRVRGAIDDVEDSLEDDLWTDVIRLDDRHGHRVFDAERRAAQQLAQALTKDGTRLGTAGRADVQEALMLLATADWIILRVGWVDAERFDGGITGKHAAHVQRELDRAEDDFADGEAAQAAARHDDAIKAYRSAWQHLQQAFDHAAKD